MTDWYLPTRLEQLVELPKTSTGKVRKELLRSWLNGGGCANSPASSAG
jgi:acyl-coenzyme A synthetase/AMP-(fatty) acid ligase